MADPFPPLVAIVLVDIFAAAKHWLETFELTREDQTNLERIFAEIDKKRISFQSAAEALLIPLNANLVVTTLHFTLGKWYDGGSDQIALTRDYLSIDRFAIDEARHPRDRAAACLIRFLAALGDAEEIENSRVRYLIEALDQLESLGDAFEVLGDQVNSARCFDVGCNLVGLVGAPEYLRCARRARRHVRKITDGQLSAGIQFKYAAAMVAAAEGDPSLRLEAYDALQDAILALPGHAVLRKQSDAFIRGCLRHDTYRPLVPLFVMSDPEFDRSQLPEVMRSLELVQPVMTDGEMNDWAAKLISNRELIIEAENGRLQLEPKTEDTTVAEADWMSWAVSHPAYYRAIPDGNSFLRAKDASNLMLVLSHELTHIFTLNGYIGLNLIALKTAVLTLTMELYGEAEVGGKMDFLRTLPQLGERSLMNLGVADHVLQLLRKLQIVRSTWSAWFEGIAVFMELSDPVEDTQAYGPPMEMLQHLIDRRPGGGDADEAAIQEAVQKYAEEIERRYSEIVGEQANTRLHQYLVARHEGYLSGYLAARAVVAAWRARLDEPLCAAVAARLLLHLTRGSTYDALPDLGLPIEEFREAARSRQMDWLRRISDIPADVLISAQTPYESDSGFLSMRWRNGKLEWLKAAELEAESMEAGKYALARAIEAWRTRPGTSGGKDHGDITRADFTTHRAKANPHEELTRAVLQRLIAPLGVLPFAEVQARFWLLRSDRAVFCLLRTSEGDAELTPGYNGALFSLPQAEFDALYAECEKRGDFRMRVTRIADVLAPGVLPHRGMGRHAIVFQYGSWMHVQMRGMLLGMTKIPPSLVDDARSRLEPDAIGTFDRDVLTDGRPFADTIRAWIEDPTPFRQADGQPAKVTEWRAELTALCEEIARDDDSTDRTPVRDALLTRLVGFDAATAQQILNRGLRALSPLGAAHSVSDIVRLLETSAQRPAPSTPLSNLLSQLLTESKLGVDVRPAFNMTNLGDTHANNAARSA